jgi:cystathionine beta-lyase
MDSVTVPLPVDDLAVLRRRRSAKWRTYPADVLPLTISEADFPLAQPIAEVLHEAVSRSDTGYAMPVPELGEAVAGFAAARWDWRVEPGSVTAVTDVSTGCAGLLRACCGPGQAVVISPPVYPPFFDWVAEVGARLIEAPLRQDGAGMWRLDLDAVRDAFRARPAAYLLCSPHNPVGRVHDRGELEAVVQLAHDYGVRVISNEIHAPLVLEGAAFTPFLTVPGAAEIAVSLLSASKAWNLADLKCAAIVAGSPAMQAVVGQLPPDGRWRIGHFGVLTTIAALTTGPALAGRAAGHPRPAPPPARRPDRRAATRCPLAAAASDLPGLAGLPADRAGRPAARVVPQPRSRRTRTRSPVRHARKRLRPAELRDQRSCARRGHRTHGIRSHLTGAGTMCASCAATGSPACPDAIGWPFRRGCRPGRGSGSTPSGCHGQWLRSPRSWPV